jgi:hypothetical protein
VIALATDHASTRSIVSGAASPGPLLFLIGRGRRDEQERGGIAVRINMRDCGRHKLADAKSRTIAKRQQQCIAQALQIAASGAEQGGQRESLSMWIERGTEAQWRGLPLGGAATAAKPLERGAYHDVAGPRMSRFHIPDGCAVARLATRPAAVAGLAPPRLEHGDVADQVLRVGGQRRDVGAVALSHKAGDPARITARNASCSC